jgi:DNA-binding GntR family transcriptional regulator
MTRNDSDARVTRADHVYDVLLREFVEGTRAPGEPLNIATLQRELNVSQTPIREALARLEHTGLVRRVALKGYRVAPFFTEWELVQLTRTRVVLEPAMTRDAALRVTEGFLDKLRETVEALDEVSRTSTDASSFSAYRSADERFHNLIAEQAGNPFIATAYASLGGQVQRFRLFSQLGTSDASFAAAEHRAVLAALAKGDEEEAAARMREHVQNAGERALRDRRRQSDGDGASEEPAHASATGSPYKPASR